MKNPVAIVFCILIALTFYFGSSSSVAFAQSEENKKAQTEDAEKENKPEPATPIRKPIYDESADAKTQIDAALAKAKNENRRVLIQWGGNWCGWCHLLHDLMANNAEIRRTIMYEYDVVLVDVGQNDKNQDLVKQFDADLKKHGLPFLTVLDADGNVVMNQETSSLESKEEGAKEHNPVAVLDFLVKYQATPSSAEQVVHEGLSRAKAENKLMFLHFGAPWCGWCHYLENWMTDPKVAKVLGKAFVDVKIDTDRMTGGEEVFRKYCEKKGGIPWFVFIDPSDESALATSDAADGNVGFPSADNEIAHFKEMLGKCKRLSKDDIDFLEESLVANRKARESANKK